METFAFENQQGEWMGVVFKIGSYVNNRSLFIEMHEIKEGKAEPYADVTVNLDGKPPHFCAYIDVANTPKLAEYLEKCEIAYPTGLSKKSGFNEYPLYVFNIEQLRRMDAEGLETYERENKIESTPVPKEKSR